MIRRGTTVIVADDLHVVDDIRPGFADCKLCGEIHTNYWTRPVYTHLGARTLGCQVARTARSMG